MLQQQCLGDEGMKLCGIKTKHLEESRTYGQGTTEESQLG